MSNRDELHTYLTAYDNCKPLTMLEKVKKLEKKLIDIAKGSNLSGSNEIKVEYDESTEKVVIVLKPSDMDTFIHNLGYVKGLEPQAIKNVLIGSKFISVDDSETEEDKVEVAFDFTDLNEFLDFPSSQTEVVLSWTNDTPKPKLQAVLNQNVTNKINNSLQLPVSHTQETLVGVDTSGAQEQIKLDSNTLQIDNGTLKVTSTPYPDTKQGNLTVTGTFEQQTANVQRNITFTNADDYTFESINSKLIIVNHCIYAFVSLKVTNNLSTSRTLHQIISNNISLPLSVVNNKILDIRGGNIGTALYIPISIDRGTYGTSPGWSTMNKKCMFNLMNHSYRDDNVAYCCVAFSADENYYAGITIEGNQTLYFTGCISIPLLF